MKTIIKSILLLGLPAMLYSCTTTTSEPEELGAWTFCECAEIHADYKRDIATETDPEARILLEEEIAIVEEDCKDFLPGENPTSDEMRAFLKKKSNCR